MTQILTPKQASFDAVPLVWFRVLIVKINVTNENYTGHENTVVMNPIKYSGYSRLVHVRLLPWLKTVRTL